MDTNRSGLLQPIKPSPEYQWNNITGTSNRGVMQPEQRYEMGIPTNLDLGGNRVWGGSSQLRANTSPSQANYTSYNPTYQQSSTPIYNNGVQAGWDTGSVSIPINPSVSPSSSGINYSTQPAYTPPSASTPAPTNNTAPTGGSLRDQFNAFRASGGYAGWDEGPAWADYQATGGAGKGPGGSGSGDSWESQINDIYAPSLQNYADTETELKRANQAQGGILQGEYTKGTEQLTEQEKSLRANLAEQRRLTEQGAISANDQARRAFQALQQQSQARFGGRGSAGMAATEIASKEFARQQGGLNTVLTNALAQFGLKDTEIGQFITQKKNDLDGWLRSANEQLTSQFNQGLLAIQGAKGQVESAKGEAKLNLLREARNTALQIQEADKNLRTQLAGNAIDSIQRITQRALTMPEITTIFNGMMAAQLTGVGGIGQSAGQAGIQFVGMGRRPEDQY